MNGQVPIKMRRKFTQYGRQVVGKTYPTLGRLVGRKTVTNAIRVRRG